ncbi:MAG: outer membrane beta-barrel protein [bacterium]
MKKFFIVAGIVCLLSTATYAAGPIGFGVQATGANINLDGPAKELYGFGFGGGVHVDFNLPLLIAFRLQGDYVSFGLNQDKFKALVANANPNSNPVDYTIDGGRLNILSVHANAKVNPFPIPIISPYITGGVGMASVSSSDITIKHPTLAFNTIPGGKTETNFSANLGLGADLNLVVVKLYLEARYTWIFASGGTSTYVPVSLGVTL